MRALPAPARLVLAPRRDRDHRVSRRRLRSFAVGTVLLVVSLGLTACAGEEQSGTPAHRVSTWVSGTGAGSEIGTLGVDNAAVDKALAQHRPASLIRTLCAIVINDALAGNSSMPTPDQQLTTDLNNAYEIEDSAGTNCYNGAAGNATLLRRSASQRKQGAVYLSEAVDRIAAVTGHVPSTTTTTLPNTGSGDPFS